MKKHTLQTLKIFSFTLLLLFTIQCSNSVKAEFILVEKNAIPYTSKQIDNNNNVYKNIEKKISKSFLNALINNSYQDFDNLLDSLNTTNSESHLNLKNYWKSYLIYNKALAYLIQKEDDKAKKLLQEAMDILEKQKNKNSEDYALLSLIKSINMKYLDNTAKVISEGKLIKKYCDFSIKLQENNIRPYFVKASLDFYTPEKYGGGKDVEKLLLKAISLNEQIRPNPYLPSWGKDQSYEMLINYYIRKDRIEEAKKYYKEAILIYPDSYTIKELATKLI